MLLWVGMRYTRNKLVNFAIWVIALNYFANSQRINPFFFFLLVIKQGRIFFFLGSLESRDLETGNSAYTETTSALKVRSHTDELECLYLLNLLTLPHIKQRRPYAFPQRKLWGIGIKPLNHHHGTAGCSVFRRQPFSQPVFPEWSLLQFYMMRA